jgi:hypothetical protein
MKVNATLLLIQFTGSMLMFGQPAAEEQPVGVGKIATNPAIYVSSLPGTNESIGVGLHGIFIVPPTRKALLEIRTPGQEPVRCVVAEGGKAAGLELVAIHEARRKVVVYYNGVTNELTLAPLATAGTASEVEREKDVSHQEHHKLRARVERERDAVQSAALPSDLPDR